METEQPYITGTTAYDELQDDALIEPDNEYSTDLDWAEKTHEQRKGVQNRWPGSTAAYGLTGMYRA